MMSLIFIVASVALLLLPLTCLTILITLQSSSSYNDHPTTFTSNRRSISNLLFSNIISGNRTKTSCHYKDLAGVKLYKKSKNVDDEKSSEVECGVCLSAVEEGDEIRELRCNHLFHRECLDSWVNTGSTTCPMCRGAVRELTMVESEQGCGVAELLVLEFCSSSRGRRHNREDNWFL